MKIPWSRFWLGVAAATLGQGLMIYASGLNAYTVVGSLMVAAAAVWSFFHNAAPKGNDNHAH